MRAPSPPPDYPRPSFHREAWIDLDGEWEFGTGEQARFDRRILVPFCPESSMSGIGEPAGGIAWYRRAFDAPAAERLVLHFGAVDYWATVWINDVEVARHQGGHTPFAVDITASVLPRRNVLTVRAVDPQTDRTIPRGKQYWVAPEGIFYTPTTGIWQSVWLEPLPARHIEGIRLWPSLDGRLDFEVAAPGEVELVASLDGAVVGRWSGPAGIGRMRLEEVAPWHPDTPNLYELRCHLVDGGDVVDTYFGLRTVGAAGGRVLLNGELFVPRLVLDQGYFPESLLTAPNPDALRQDVELAKALGFNGARKHQKIEDPRWLYWADRLGFVVWEEMPSFHEHSTEAERRLESEWTAAVRRDRDHPSIVAWVPANESFGLDRIETSLRSDFLVRLYHRTKELDGTRPVVSNDGWEHALTDLCTVHDYSPPELLARRYRSLSTALDGAAAGRRIFDPGFEYRGEPVLVTEFGGLIVAGSGGWGWTEVQDDKAFASSYQSLVGALMAPGPVQGFCYTQLADVEQERNGLVTADRKPKVDPGLIAAATRAPKQEAT